MKLLFLLCFFLFLLHFEQGSYNVNIGVNFDIFENVGVMNRIEIEDMLFRDGFGNVQILLDDRIGDNEASRWEKF